MALLLLLGLITAFDAMAIDIYLPAFPALATQFGVEEPRVQVTLGVFLLGLAIGQAAFGPLLDRFGRRGPLLAGIALFSAGSVLAALSTSLEMLVAARFVQALGGAAALVAPRAMISDLCDERQSARIFSLLMQVVAIVPLLAPLVGSAILGVAGWQAIFWSLAATGVLALLIGGAALPETLARERRTDAGLAQAFSGYAPLLHNPTFVRDALVGGMLMAGLFAYISGSPLAIASAYGLSPGAYSMIFAVGGLVMIVAAQANIMLLRHFAIRTLVRAALLGLVVMTALLAASSLLGAGLPLYVSLLWGVIACLSLLFGNNAAEVMAHMPERAGSASALLGVIQYGFGAAAGGMSAALSSDPRVSVAAVLAATAVIALLLDMSRRRFPAPRCLSG